MYPKEYEVVLKCAYEECENFNKEFDRMYVKHRDEEDEEYFWLYFSLDGEAVCPKCNKLGMVDNPE